MAQLPQDNAVNPVALGDDDAANINIQTPPTANEPNQDTTTTTK